MLAIIGILYGALVAMVQPNMKKLVAYSSVSHLGFVVLGIFSFTQLGMDGAVYQMLNHGISTGALFLLVGFLYERRHSLEIADYGGVATVAPWLSTAFLITTLASIGLPMLNNFVGEFLVLQGAAMPISPGPFAPRIGVILSACYMLWLYQRVFYGETGAEVRAHIPDLTPREWAAVVPLIVMMVWMGVYSQSFLAPEGETTARVLEQSQVNVPFSARGAGVPPAMPASLAGVSLLSRIGTSAGFHRALRAAGKMPATDAGIAGWKPAPRTLKGTLIWLCASTRAVVLPTGARKDCEYTPIHTIMTMSGTTAAHSRGFRSGLRANLGPVSP